MSGPEPAPTEMVPPLRSSKEIQGNILAGFNKDHRVFLFLQFTDRDLTQRWLDQLIPRIATTEQVTVFNDQFSGARRSSGGDDPESLTAIWLNVSFTASGLRKLAPNHAAAFDTPPDLLRPLVEGPAARAGELGDVGPLSQPAQWIFGNQPPLNQEQPAVHVDALLIIEADDPDDLREELQRQHTMVARHHVVIVFEQQGETLPGERRGHEHFGFKDGISQPGIKGYDYTELNPDDPNEVQKRGHPGTEMVDADQFVLGKTADGDDDGNWNGPEWMRNGSFQVFRRLRQDVPGWWAQVRELREQVRKELGGLAADDPLTEDLMAAKLVGRWRSGTPLDQAPERDLRSGRDPKEDNHFDFDEDPHGYKTPEFAHIRKVYPRNDEDFHDDEHRMIRRGVPYGLPFDPAMGRGWGVDDERGLLFLAYMANLEQQFEYVQKLFANNPDFPRPKSLDGPITGADPVIGQPPAESQATLHLDERREVHLSFQRFVHTTGALYAFAPSLPTLNQWANGEG